MGSEHFQYSNTPILQYSFALLLPDEQELVLPFLLACGWLLSLIAKNVRTERIPGYLEFVAIIKPEPDLGRIFARVL